MQFKGEERGKEGERKGQMLGEIREVRDAMDRKLRERPVR